MYYLVQDHERGNSPKFGAPNEKVALFKYEEATGIELEDGDNVMVYELAVDETGHPVSRHLDEL